MFRKKKPAASSSSSKGTSIAKKATAKKSASTGTETFAADTRFKVPSSVISRRNQDGTVVLMKIDDATSFYKINGISAEVFRAFTTTQSVETVTEHFSGLYKGRVKTLPREIKTLVQELMGFKLLEMTKSPLASTFPPPLGTPKSSGFGTIKEFNLESLESEVLNDSIYLDVFAGSDLRLKTDVTPIHDALSKVLQLDGITHRWKADAPVSNPSAVRAGLIAQQVAVHMPELVRKDKATGKLAVDYQKLSSYLVEAVKDLNRTINDQEERISRLEAASGLQHH
ncbi:MAG: tail fiber domain-containing protein [Bdellovibrionia bacterium]